MSPMVSKGYRHCRIQKLCCAYERAEPGMQVGPRLGGRTDVAASSVWAKSNRFAKSFDRSGASPYQINLLVLTNEVFYREIDRHKIS